MSYTEYKDLYKRAQKSDNSKYKLFYFDGMNHRISTYGNWEKYFNDLIKIRDDITEKLLEKEEKENTKIIDRDPDTIFLKRNKDMPKGNISSDNLNPFVGRGDEIYISIYNNSIEDKEMIDLFCKVLKKNNFHYDFHFASAKYETDKGSERVNKFYKGYCIAFLDDKAHKNNLKIIDQKIVNTKKQNLEL
ncbi:MAG: hypothetical protein ACOCP8_06070 [archaeon]